MPYCRCGAPWTSAGSWSCSSSRTTVSSHWVSTAGSLGRGLGGGGLPTHLTLPFSPSQPAPAAHSPGHGFQPGPRGHLPFQGLSAVGRSGEVRQKIMQAATLRTAPLGAEAPPPRTVSPLALLLPCPHSQAAGGPGTPPHLARLSCTAPLPRHCLHPRAGPDSLAGRGAPQPSPPPSGPRQLPQWQRGS